MAASPWKDPRLECPPDGTTVWVKQIYGHPFQATFQISRGTFATTLLDTAGTDIPWYQVYLWRPI